MRAFGRGDATVGRTGLVVVSSNRGMAGPYDQNVLHVAMEYTKHLQGERELITVGERGRGAMLRRGVPVAADWSRLNERLTIDDVAPLSTHLLQRFESGEYGRVAMAYTQYREGVRGRPTVRQLLPVAIPPADLPRAFLLEPDAAALLQALLPRVIQAQVYEGVLESFTAEHTARVFAMHSAGTNATELSGSLRLSYNKTRQEAITAEMSEVTSVLALESGS
jgi:F-type H+-transporting ATPase subunit gamma